MILGNKLIPYNKTLAVLSIDILEVMITENEMTILELLDQTRMPFNQLLFCLDFLFAVGYITYTEGKICLQK